MLKWPLFKIFTVKNCAKCMNASKVKRPETEFQNISGVENNEMCSMHDIAVRWMVSVQQIQNQSRGDLCCAPFQRDMIHQIGLWPGLSRATVQKARKYLEWLSYTNNFSWFSFNITHVSFYIHIYLEFIYDPINPSVTQHSFEQLIDFYQ